MKRVWDRASGAGDDLQYRHEDNDLMNTCMQT